VLARLAARFLRPYKRRLCQLAALELIQTGCAIALPWLSSVIIGRGVVNASGNEILTIAGIMLLVLAVQLASAVFSCLASSRLSADTSRELRLAVFDATLRMPTGRLSSIGTAPLVTRTVNDVQQVYSVFITTFSLFVSAPLLFLWATSFAIFQDSQLSVVLYSLVAVLAIVLTTLLRVAVRRSRAMQESLDQVGRVVREQISGVRVIRSLNKSGYELRRLLGVSEDLQIASTRATQVSSVLLPTITTTVNVFAVPLLWVVGQQAVHGGIRIGVVVAFVGYLAQILSAGTLASFALLSLPRAAASARRILEVLEPDGESPPEHQAPAASAGPSSGPLASALGRVVVDQVSYRLAEQARPVLADVSFTAESATFTGIVGVTGSGKSTLLTLLAHQAEPTHGRIFVNLPLRQADQRPALGYLPQEAVLFSGSIAENLRLARPGANDDELWRALSLAQADAFVRQLKGGLDASLQAGGRNLSGGQRQRLAIARLILGRYTVCLLDDPFSALDLATAAQVLAGLRTGCATSTILLTSQRVAALVAADNVIVLDEGRIAAQGRHQELLSAVPLYRELVRLQSDDLLATGQP
jgi:ATP-binding cassette subfamily B multidrug efflux pump